MTTDEKKKALQDAGVKVRANASDETIEELWQEHSGETPEPEEFTETESAEVEEIDINSDLPDEVPDDAVIEINVTSEAPEYADTVETVSQPGRFTMEEFEHFRDQHATKQEGSKTPAVFAWADANLSSEDFNEVYAGKTVNGKKVKAK